MDIAAETTIVPTPPECFDEGLRSFPSLSAGVPSTTETYALNHNKRESDDVLSVETVSKNNKIDQTKADRQSTESSVPPASTTDEVDMTTDPNGSHQTPVALHHEPDVVVENANGHVTMAPNPMSTVSKTADTVYGDCNGAFTSAPIPLTNGQQEDPAAETSSKGDFEDVWSPATKLKRRLEDTKDLIVCPGVYDGFSARIALSVGFDTMYMVRVRFLHLSQEHSKGNGD